MSHVTPPTSLVSAYPVQYEFDVVVRDGSTLHLRPVRTSDEEGLHGLYDRLSPESLRYRFFAIPSGSHEEVARLLRADHDNEFVLVAEAGSRLVGVAAYFRDRKAPARAEVAFAIADALQGRGIGTRMLEALAGIARDHHVEVFDAYVLLGNHRMMSVFLDSGFQVERRLEGGIIHVVLTLEPTARYETRAAERSQAAATASMKHFFEPRSVVVVGANRERGKIGAEILHNVAAGGFAGRLFVVHPFASSVQGVAAFPAVTAVPGEIDLAVICVPCARVAAAVDDCIAKGVKALVIISAGFGETGGAGRTLEREILDKVRAAGIRMIGPNCMGIINTDRAVRLNATFAPIGPVEGRVAFSTQSGALGLAILEHVQQLNLGLSTFVSVGNKADVSGNDLLQYWADDPRTDVILLYVESFGNPRRFSQIARRVARKKPIVAVKSGRSPSGARAASSHTGALATSDAVVDALFRQAGIIRAATVEELFDIAALLAHQPVPAGPRVAILSNAGGPAILAADACEAHGLQLTALSDATILGLRRILPLAASVGNPVDMLASATPEQYREATALLLADQQVDSLLVIFIPPLVTDADEAAHAIAAGAAGAGKPVLASFMGARGAPPELAPVPSYRFPEAAVTALARTTEYGAWRRRPLGDRPSPEGIQRDAVRRVIDRAMTRGDGWLTPSETQALLDSIGITAAATSVITTADEAVAAAHDIGYPVALKAAGAEIVHKTDVGGVMLDISNEHDLREAYATLTSHVGDAMTAAVVQHMVPGGVELLIGATVDPTFGPVVACGMGGVLVDLLHDTTFRLHPLTDVDATEMVAGLKSIALLRGYRGHPPADERAVVDALLRVSALVEICPDIQEMEINPLKVFEHGVRAVDVRVRIGRPRPGPPTRRISY
ncbi:MAG TPA: GNAT family N-acetyltransferase [Vicinamibacterales bacterium]|nr:GNAT family N-acetyltransferase [Vicinamibacterales bacterium]